MRLQLRRHNALLWWIGAAALVVSAAGIVRIADGEALGATWRAARSQPVALLAVVLLYASAFLIRALLWSRVLPGLPLGHALAGIHVALGANHVLPLRLGEALRVTSVVRRTTVALAPATASTVMLRAADILAVVALALLLGPRVTTSLTAGWAALAIMVVAALWVAGVWWLRRVRTRHRLDMRASVGTVAAGAVTAWVLESAVVWQAAAWAGVDLTLADAVLVTAVTIAAQIVAIAPGGIGTYEAAASGALIALGAEPAAALAAALGAHAVKTAYSLLAGAVALFVPAPSAFGRLRLPPPPRTPARGAREVAPSGVSDAPVVLFLPAHNEADRIGDVLARVPSQVCGRRVEVLVIDDGSTDATALVATSLGAEVVSLPANRGLGAAVRRGLSAAVARDTAAVAFCDADGEYRPEELERVVAPVLAGRADYVVGSRFDGTIERMLAHRRLGNVVLTKMLAFVARRPISDGQSGYRAFSRQAAADAEIIHDFNYAQVITLDLLAKGYRYAEVPITYCFRSAGTSFVRLVPYLRHVVPAIHRELNLPA